MNRSAGQPGWMGSGWMIGIVIGVCGAANPGSAQSTDDASGKLRVDLPYQAKRSDPIEHEVEFVAVVTAPYHTKLLRVWLPIPQNDAGQEVLASELTTFPETVAPKLGTEPVFGNRFAYYEFANPAGGQMIRHRFKVRVRQLDWEVDPTTVQAPKLWPEAFAPYLRQESVSEPDQLAAVLKDMSSVTDATAPPFFRAMRWIDANLSYDHARASLRADADHAWRTRHGHCSDYHGLCAVMGRSLGYPTRVTYGINLFPKNSPSHCKVEAFLPPYGWVSFDLSETQKLAKKIAESTTLAPADKERLIAAARGRLQRGFRENSWLLLTKGTDYDLTPKTSAKVRVVRTLYAEADGVPLPDPDPANANQKTFAWMTAHRYQADKPFQRPFEDMSTLEPQR